MAISKPKGSLAGRKQFVEQSPNQASNTSISASVIGTSCGPVVGHGPLRPFLLCRASPSSNWLAANSRRGRRATIPVTAFVSVEIFDDEPWRPCGTQTPSGERRKFVRRRHVRIEERHLARAEPSAHGRQTPGQATPVKAGSRRSRARGARALTGVAGPASPRCRSPMSRQSRAHCADFLSAKEKLDSRKVRSCQKSCDKPRTSHDRPRRTLRLLSCYQAVDVRRLVGSTKSFDKLRRDKEIEKGVARADFLLALCGRYAGVALGE